MLRKKLTKIIVAALLGIAIISPFRLQREVPIEKTPIIETQKKSIDYSAAILDNLEQINKLEIYQASLKQDIEIKGKWDNCLFRSNKTIQVRANGIYKLDLDKIEVIQGTDTVTILADIETSVEIYDFSYEVEKGYLVFYEQELKDQEYGSIILEAKEQMTNKTYEEDYMSIVKKRAEEILIDKVGEVTNQYDIKVIWR